MNLETIRFEITTILCLYCKQPVQKDLGLDYHIDCQLEILSYIPGFETLQQIELEPKIAFNFPALNLEMINRPIIYREVGQFDFISRFQTFFTVENNDMERSDESDTDYLPCLNPSDFYLAPISLDLSRLTFEGKSNALVQLNLVFAKTYGTEYTVRLDWLKKKKVSKTKEKKIKKYGKIPNILIKEQKRHKKLQRRY